MLDERLNIRTLKSDLLVEASLTRAGIDKARVLNTRNKCGFGLEAFSLVSLAPPKLVTNASGSHFTNVVVAASKSRVSSESTTI